MYDEATGEFFDLGFALGSGLSMGAGEDDDDEAYHRFGLMDEVRAITKSKINPILAYAAERIDTHTGSEYPDRWVDYPEPENAERAELLAPIIPRLAAARKNSAEIDVVLADWLYARVLTEHAEAEQWRMRVIRYRKHPEYSGAMLHRYMQRALATPTEADEHRQAAFAAGEDTEERQLQVMWIVECLLTAMEISAAGAQSAWVAALSDLLDEYDRVTAPDFVDPVDAAFAAHASWVAAH